MIILGSDHAGFDLKEYIKEYLKKLKIEYEDYGTYSSDSVDYPDIALKVAKKVANKNKGILICGTGIGMSIVANKIKGVRAALCHNEYEAEMSRAHNDSNILVLGGRILSPELAKKIVKKWLDTKFEGNRHKRRLDKIKEIEKGL